MNDPEEMLPLQGVAKDVLFEMVTAAEAAALLKVGYKRVHALIGKMALAARYATIEEELQLVRDGRVKSLPGVRPPGARITLLRRDEVEGRAPGKKGRPSRKHLA